MNNLQKLALGIVFGYVMGEMLGLEKSECIYAAGLTAIAPMIWIIEDLFKKKNKQSS